jgi:hypothetical protein
VTMIANGIPLELRPGGRTSQLRRQRPVPDQRSIRTETVPRHRLSVRFKTTTRNRTRSHNTGPIARSALAGTGRRPTTSRSSTSRRTATSRWAAEQAEDDQPQPATPPDNIGPRSTPDRRARGLCGASLPGGSRSSPASVTIRPTSILARSSIWPDCVRSIRST